MFVAYYNHERLHSAIGLITTAVLLAGRAEAIHGAREHKLAAALALRRAGGHALSARSTRPVAHPTRHQSPPRDHG